MFTVTIHDCKVETFRAGGKGGQNQNKRDTGVRVRHLPSGAVGEARDNRTQGENKKAAFTRMGQSAAFQSWAKLKALELEPVEDIVDRQMDPDNLVIEYGPFGKKK